MSYVAISGTWRSESSVIGQDVETAVDDLIAQEWGVVTGGALGVDYVATSRVLAKCDRPDSLIVVIPTSLAIYEAHYRRRAEEGVISADLALALIKQLESVYDSVIGRLVEMPALEVNVDSYYRRNSRVLELASKLLAFQLDESPGTGDTVAKAEARGLPVSLRTYSTHADGHVVRV